MFGLHTHYVLCLYSLLNATFFSLDMRDMCVNGKYTLSATSQLFSVSKYILFCRSSVAELKVITPVKKTSLKNPVSLVSSFISANDVENRKTFCCVHVKCCASVLIKTYICSPISHVDDDTMGRIQQPEQIC